MSFLELFIVSFFIAVVIYVICLIVQCYHVFISEGFIVYFVFGIAKCLLKGMLILCLVGFFILLFVIVSFIFMKI